MIHLYVPANCFLPSFLPSFIITSRLYLFIINAKNNWNHYVIASSYKHTCTIIPVAATSVTVLDKLYSSSIGSGMLCVCCANGIFYSTTFTDAIVV